MRVSSVSTDSIEHHFHLREGVRYAQGRASHGTFFLVPAFPGDLQKGLFARSAPTTSASRSDTSVPASREKAKEWIELGGACCSGGALMRVACGRRFSRSVSNLGGGSPRGAGASAGS